MNLVQHTFETLHLGAWIDRRQRQLPSSRIKNSKFDLLDPLRKWLDGIEIDNSAFAHRICRLIPSQCPFEREIKLLGLNIKIPPMCKLNPLYNEVIALRFRAICYLADTCGEDISVYC
ncbi:MAG: Mo-dependent nitrogenase C-terminal domain-containing protein [Pleurocapsa sp.]